MYSYIVEAFLCGNIKSSLPMLTYILESLIPSCDPDLINRGVKITAWDPSTRRCSSFSVDTGWFVSFRSVLRDPIHPLECVLRFLDDRCCTPEVVCWQTLPKLRPTVTLVIYFEKREGVWAKSNEQVTGERPQT